MEICSSKEQTPKVGTGADGVEVGSGEPYPRICNNPNPCPGNQNVLPANTKERKLGVHCSPLPPPVTFECLDKPSIIPDMTKPIFCTWPQDPAPPTPPCPANRPDPLLSIPEHIIPQVVTVVDPGKTEFMKPTFNHPLCPDAQFTLTIDPPKKKEVQIRMPECECPVRPPQRPWRQCVENQLINDQVRRPLARWCHKRELPPLVLPCHEMARIQMKVTQRQKEKEKQEERVQERECQMLKSRYRHSLWNYTVESLLERKRNKEAQKLKQEADDTKQLLADVKAENDRNSEEWDSRAKRLMLYRKGLIRDFHAAMANSKMLKDIEDAKNVSKGCENEKTANPFLTQSCIERAMAANDYSEHKKREKIVRPNPKLLEALQRDEKRVLERQAEMENELREAQKLMHVCPLALPESYKKYIAEPVCDDDVTAKRNLKFRKELFSEIHDKLAADAFVEAHENEIDRQACEFNNYKRTVEALRKQKEKQLIDEKVQYNIRMSEKAGEVLVQMRQKQQRRAGEYDSLKNQWEADFAEKEATKNLSRDKRLEAVYANFWNRRNEELCKQQLLDPSRQWARERLVAVENYAQECDRKSVRRKAAEEIQLYQLAQIDDKKCREMKEKHLSDVWGCKMKREYEQEMCEMKDYAKSCMKDWEAKGRPLKGMQHAVKRWDYDAGMYPFANPMEQVANKSIANRMKDVNCPTLETTANRLGFDRGSHN